MNDIVTNELGEWLRRLLFEKRLTQAEVARRAGLSKTTITDIVRAQRIPSASVLRQLAVGLGNDPAEIEMLAREALHRAGYIDEPAELTNNEKIAFLAQRSFFTGVNNHDIHIQ